MEGHKAQQRPVKYGRPARGRGGRRSANPSARKRRAPSPSASIPVCPVCQVNESPQYKCPKCLSPYCSVGCCRKHKEDCHGKKVPLSPGEQDASPSKRSTPIADKRSSVHQEGSAKDIAITPPDYSAYGPEWVLSSNARDQLKVNARFLKERLQDKGLRQRIAGILRCPDTPIRKYSTTTFREKALHQLDARLLDDLRVIGGILERHEETLPLEEWLCQSDRSSSQLRLGGGSDTPPVTSFRSLPKTDSVEDTSNSDDDPPSSEEDTTSVGSDGSAAS